MFILAEVVFKFATEVFKLAVVKFKLLMLVFKLAVVKFVFAICTSTVPLQACNVEYPVVDCKVTCEEPLITPLAPANRIGDSLPTFPAFQ